MPNPRRDDNMTFTAPGDGSATLDFLLRRMRHKGNFAALVGVAAIRNTAIRLLLLEHMHDRARAQHAGDPHRQSRAWRHRIG